MVKTLKEDKHLIKPDLVCDEVTVHKNNAVSFGCGSVISKQAVKNHLHDHF